MRAKRLVWNTVSSFVMQIVTFACGFILPQLILRSYGSEVNGLVNSITQFLQVISLLELGIGAVMQFSLYEPLSAGDMESISCIMSSGTKFFRAVGRILGAYVIFLVIMYPFMTNQRFSGIYTAFLILAMSVSLFAQYYFGITDQILLLADQRGYIQYCIQMAALALNTIVCAILMLRGFSIHMVKLTTSIIYIMRPLLLRGYVNRHYNIDRNKAYDKEPIGQKWNGIAQHIAAFVLDGTDNIVLTLFSSLTNVSIYSIYNMIILGIKNIFISLSGGVQSVFGEMIAKKEVNQLLVLFGRVEWIMHTGVIFVFGCTAVLIVPFIEIYTKGVHDAVYNVPFFALLLTCANAMHCLRLPYNILIKAGGHYRQTQSNYIIAALINIITSVILVRKSGLVGVAIGTLAAMSYQTIWMAYYDSKNLVKYPFKRFAKQVCTDVLAFCAAFFITQSFEMKTDTYTAWLVLAVRTGLVWFVVLLAVNLLFYYDNVQYVAGQMLRKR